MLHVYKSYKLTRANNVVVFDQHVVWILRKQMLHNLRLESWRCCPQIFIRT